MASKTTGTKKNAKQSTAKKRQPTKKTSAKSAKSAKTTRKNTTSKAVPQEESFLATEILIWVTLAVGILLTISNFGLAGAFGRKIAALQQGMMGWMAYVFPLLLFCGVAFVVSNKGNRIAYIKTVAGVVLLVQCCVLFELIDEKGGSVGKAIAVRLVPAIGKVGTYVVVIILMVICVVLITEKSILKGMKIGGEKAYDRAREDMQKRKEEAEERRARREAMRVDYQVSGVSFNSTVGGKENEAEKAEEKAGKEAKESTEKKATRRSRKDMSSVLAGAEEAAAKHIMEQTGKIALDDVVINRAMPLSATELIPDPEPVPLEPVKEKLPKFLKGAMQEAEKKTESGKDIQTDLPDPVAPATSRCGIFAISDTTTLPEMSRPVANAIRDLLFLNSSDSRRSRSITAVFSLFGTSMPTAAFPGIGASIRISAAARFSLMSSASPTILLTFTPISGCNS